MPIIKSAKKRVRVAEKKGAKNAKTKKGLRAAIKAFHGAITNGKQVSESQRKAQSAIDNAVKKGVMSKNKAARKKKQLSAKAKTTGSAKPVAKKVAKPAAKKVAAKKPAAKKSVKKSTKK